MAEHRKFAFDTVFEGAGEVAASPGAYKRLYTAAEVEQIRAQARAEGEAAALQRAEAQTAQALPQLAEAARFALPSLVQAAHEHRVGSAELALAAARVGAALEAALAAEGLHAEALPIPITPTSETDHG